MGSVAHIGVVILAIICFANSSAVLSAGEANVYEYVAKTSVGVAEPKYFISQYIIKGNLTVQPWPKSDKSTDQTFVLALNGLKHKSFYGTEYTEGNEEQFATNDKSQLDKAFLVSYSNHGLFQAIKYQKDETDVSKNIKKSIASMLEFNLLKQAAKNPNMNGQEDVVEDTVYGSCNIKIIDDPKEYNINQKGERMITKVYKPKECSNFIYDTRHYLESDDDYRMKIEEQLETYAAIHYFVDGNSSEADFIKNVERFENYEMKMGLQSNYTHMHIVRAMQKINLIEKRKNLGLFNHLSDSMFVDIDFNLSLNKKELQKDVAADAKINIEDRMIKIKKLLNKAVKYTQKNHLVTFEPGLENEQLLNNIMSLMQDFNVEQFQHLHQNIMSITGPDAEMIKFIVNYAIPHIGTKASTSFTLNLIINKKMSDADAAHVLCILSTFLNNPTKETLLNFEVLINEESQLSASVKKQAILGFGHIISKVYAESDMSDDDKVLLDRYLKYFRNSMKDASSVEMKIVYIMALANTRNSEAVKYLLDVFEKTTENIERISVAVIFALSKTIDDTQAQAYDVLKDLIIDNAKSDKIRIAAYDVVIRKPNLSIKDVNLIHKAMSGNENLYCYHFLHLQNLDKAGWMPEVMVGIFEKMEMNKLQQSEELFYDRVARLTGTMFPGSSTNYRIVKVLENHVPTMINVENIEKIGKKFNTVYGVYAHGNLNKLFEAINEVESKKETTYMDLWMSWAQWVNMVHCDESYVKSNSEPMDILLRLQESLLRALNNRAVIYDKLHSFSVPTCFGIPVTFEMKSPNLFVSKFNIEKRIRTPEIIVNASLDLNHWRHGYVGAKIDNPLSQLTHFVKTPNLLDVSAKIDLSIIFDFSTSTLKIILPLVNPKHEFKQGIASHILTKVSITNGDEAEKPCKDCGELIVGTGRTHLFDKADEKESDFLGLKYSQNVYDLDLAFMSIAERLQHRVSSIESTKIYRVGTLLVVEPNTIKTFSQLELTLSSNTELFEKPEPKYLLPGFNYDFRFKLAGKRNVDGEVMDIGGLKYGLNYSLGGTFQTFAGDLYKVYNTKCLSSSTPCDYVHASLVLNFPLYAMSELSSQQIVMQAKIRNYVHSSDNMAERSLCNITVTGLLTEKAKCRCNGDRRNPLFVYPHPSFPMTMKCIVNSLVERNFIIYETDLRSVDSNSLDSDDPIMQVFQMAIMKDQMSKMMNPSELYEQKLPFKTEYPNSPLLTQEYLEDLKISNKADKFKTEDAKIITVLPGVIINEKNETYIAELKDWEKVHSSDEGNYIVFAKVIDSQKLAMRIYQDGHDLKLQPTDADAEDEEEQNRYCENISNETAIYFDGETVNSTDRNVILPRNETMLPNICTFSLYRSDKFVRIKLKSEVLIIYYTPNIITIAYKNYRDTTYYFECDKE